MVFYNKVMFTDESNLGPQKSGKHWVRKQNDEDWCDSRF
jgi:hypothetical protein